MFRIGCAVLLMLPTAAQGRDLFVNNVDGHDEFTGQTEYPLGAEGPTQTIGRALQLTFPGDRVILANTGQPYRESITLIGNRNSGFETMPFVLEGNGAVLDGRIAVPAESWEHFGGDLWRFRPHRMANLMLFSGDNPAVYRTPPANGRVPELAPLEWTLADGWAWFRVEPGRYPDQYPLSISLYAVGITLYRVDTVAITNLTVQGYQLDGINVFDGVTECRLIGITSRGNGRAGLTIANSSRAIVDRCQLRENRVVQLLTEGYSRSRIEETVLLADVAPAYRHHGAQLTIDGEPIGPGSAP